VLSAYDWPGNIRELANVIERAVLLCDGLELLPSHLPPKITRCDGRAAVPADPTLRGQERAMIVQALNDHYWNQSKAARALGISRDNLRYRIKKYNITRDGAYAVFSRHPGRGNGSTTGEARSARVKRARPCAIMGRYAIA